MVQRMASPSPLGVVARLHELNLKLDLAVPAHLASGEELVRT